MALENNKMLLSIIVPMYNVAPYVERCLRSLTNQDLAPDQYEIICINDGSPDNSAAIVENLQKEFSQIVLLNQENQGVSMARNNAIQRAKGKYLLAVDADDYIAPNCLASVIKKAEENNLDVLYAPFEWLDVYGKVRFRSDFSDFEQHIDQGYNAYFKVRGKNSGSPDRSWAILYKVDFLRKHQIWYPKNVPYLEDGLFLGKVFSFAQRVGYTNEDFYFFTTRPGSATNSGLFLDDKALDGFKNAIIDWMDFNERNKKVRTISSTQKTLYNHVLAKFVFLGFTNLKRRNEFDKFREYYAFLVGLGLRKMSATHVQGVYKKLILYYNISGRLLYKIIPMRSAIYKKYRI